MIFLFKYLKTLTILTFLGLPNIGGHAQTTCDERVLILAGKSVYDQVPTFSSSSGWQFGDQIYTPRQDTTVQKCETAKVGFFANKKTWYKVRLKNRYGWVYSEHTRAVEQRYGFAKNPAVRFISERRASPITAASAEGIPSLGRWPFLSMAFLCIVLGMLGKVLHDEVEKTENLSIRSCFKIRKIIKAFIAAPMIFGIVLQVGNFSIQGDFAALMFFCAAFQNGFFWQTLIPTAKVVPATSN